MSTSAARLLAPAILVLLAAGIVAAGVVGGDEHDEERAAERSSTTTTVPDGDAGVPTTATTAPTTTSSTRPASTTTRPGSTTTTAAGATTTATTRPAGTATTARPAPPGTVPNLADLVVHTSTEGGAIRFSVENAGPSSAAGITLTLTGIPGGLAPGSGVSCQGTGTITCSVAASGVGGIIGYVDVLAAGSCPATVTVTAVSPVEDPNPADNRRSRAVC